MEQLPLTAFLNKYFGAFALAVLHALHVSPANVHAPIPNFVAMQILVVLLLTALFVAVRLRLSVEQPGALQHVTEGVQAFVGNMANEVIGQESARFVPYLMALGIFILTCNLIGLIPGLESPTAVPGVPLALAFLTFLYYHYQGVRTNGPIGYLKHFIGPQDKEMPLAMRLLLPFLLFPIEIFSHTARIMSLTIRLFANMFAGEMVTLVFFSLIPLGFQSCSRDCTWACR